MTLVDNTSVDNNVDEKLIIDILDDNIAIGNEVIESARTGDTWSIYLIALNYYSKSKFEKAMSWWSILAQKGHGQSQCELGCMFFNGDGVEENIDIAEYWFLEAEKNGEFSATLHIGIVQAKRHDYKSAFYWYMRAANQSHPVGQYFVGMCYLNGEGVTQDYEQAMEWYTLSAQQGCAEAQYDIGCMHECGNGMIIDKYQALCWYTKSLFNGFKLASEHIKRLNEEGYVIKI